MPMRNDSFGWGGGNIEPQMSFDDGPEQPGLSKTLEVNAHCLVLGSANSLPLLGANRGTTSIDTKKPRAMAGFQVYCRIGS